MAQTAPSLRLTYDGAAEILAAAVAKAIETAKYAADVDLLLHLERELRQLRARSAS